MAKRSGWMVAAVVGLGVFGGVGFGQGGAAPVAGKRAMTFEDLMAMKRVSDPQISPGGRWVMFSVTEVSLEKNTKITNLWVVPLGVGGGMTADSSAALRNDKQLGGGGQKAEAGPPPAAKDDKSVGVVGGGAATADSSAALRNDKKERQLTFGEVSQTYGRFSPDGRWVSLISGGGGTSQIWTAAWDEATGTMQKPYPLTSVSTEADGAEWSPDSQRLMFVSSVYPECSVKGGVDTAAMNGVPGAVVARPAADSSAALRNDKKAALGNDKQRGNDKKEAATWAEEEACNKAKDEAAAKSKVKAQIWDSLLYRHWDQYTGKKRSHVLVVSRANGEDVRDLTPASAVGDAEVPTFSLGGPIGYAWAPDSKEIAYVANLDKVPAASTNNDVFTLRLDEPGAKAVKVSNSLGSDDGPQYSPDGKYLAFRSQERAGYESDRFRLMVLDRKNGTTWEALPKFRGWVDEFVWVPDSASIAFTSGAEGAEGIYSIDIWNKQQHVNNRTLVGLAWSGEYGDLRVTQTKIGEGDVIILATKMTVASPSELVKINGGMLGHTFYDISTFEIPGLTGKISDPKQTGELVEDFTAPNDKEESLTHINSDKLRELSLSSLGYFWFTGAEGSKVQAFVIKPPNFDPKKKYPVKFLIHGGPQGAWGDAWSYRWNPELMAASGYVVVMVNPRGSTGYGQAFIDGVNGDWGGKAYVDLMKGLDAAEAKFPFIDKDRECALGASYGGYMADWVLTHTNRFKCIVTHDGMFDPVSAYGATEEMWFNEWEFRRPGDKEPAQPWRYQALPASEDPFRKWSPMLSIKSAKTPTLVIHSQRDYRLDVSQGFELFTALQRLGVPSKFLYFPDEGHWVLKPQNSQLWYETVGDWCDRWTKSGKYAEK